MKNPLVLALSLCIACTLCAGTLHALDELYVGLGLELNSNSQENPAVAAGGNLSAGLKLDELFDVGIKIGFSHDFNELGVLELQGLFRYQLPVSISGLFVQAEMGVAILFYESNSYPAFIGGIAAGWRIFPGGDKWYLEPTIRIGYPFIWSVGITFGIPISIKGEE